jgi:glyoxylate/hydroxypyruvate reductase A
MKVLLCGDFDAAEREQWQQALAAAMPEAVWLDPQAAQRDPAQVQAAVVANPPPGSLQGLPKLGLIQSLWAGVDRLLADATVPPQVPIARMVDPAMNAAMAQTALWAVLSLHRGFFAYARRQREGVWQAHAQRRADEVRVLILGQGQMGQAAAACIAQQGYVLSTWRRDGTPLEARLSEADIVINLLPLTPETRALLDRDFFAALPAKAGVVNLGRGAHVVDADLLSALDSGHLRHAVLDVFQTEPLPPGHPFWQHPRVTMLPHAAAGTDARSAAAVAVANLRAWRDGGQVLNLVQRQRGY